MKSYVSAQSLEDECGTEYIHHLVPVFLRTYIGGTICAPYKFLFEISALVFTTTPDVKYAVVYQPSLRR